MNLTPPVPFHSAVTKQADEFFSSANFLVAKLTDYCNIRCKYCHQDALNGKPILIPMETFKNAVRLILKPSKAPVVYVQFHGGEPLLCPEEFFREAVAFCKEELETATRKVEFAIQTNLVRVTPEKQAMLRDLKISLSFSLDGPPEINDQLRQGGRRIVDNHRALKAAGMESGTICLVQPTNWDRMGEVIDFFQKEGIKNIRFNLMVPDGRGKEVDSTTTEKLFNAKKIIFDHMMDTQGREVMDATLYNAMKRFMKPNGAPSSFEYHGCEALYCQAGRSLYSINPDGSFYACDRIAESPSWSMGNVNRPFLAAEKELALKIRKGFHQKDDWWSRCEGCDAKKICEFSCSAYYVDKVDTREIECQYTKTMYSYFLERKEEIREFVTHISPPVFIDEKKPLQEQPEETWVVKDIASDAFYNSLSLVDTLAANKNYQLFLRNSQYFLYLFKRDKIFEVDETVAAIAKFNGALSPELIQTVLSESYPKGKLKETLDNMQRLIPEVFWQAKSSKHLQQLEALSV